MVALEQKTGTAADHVVWLMNGLVCTASALALVEEDLVALQVLALVHGCVADADDITASILQVIFDVLTSG